MKLLFSHNETPSIIITMEVDDLPIELEVADALKSGHLMMGTAESCTGGKIASMITSMAGSSEYFTGGVVAYCNEVKHHVLGVSEADLNTFGAVSQPVVEQMARGTMRVPPCRRTKQTREPLLSPGKDRPARSFPVFGTGNSSERMRNFELLGVGSCPTGFSRRPISLNMIKNNE